MDTILVVEDEIAICRMLGEGLREYGYQVLMAENGDEAIAICSKYPNPIQVLLCDVVMPGLRARELIRIAIGIYPNIRVLLMTGYPDQYPFGVEDSGVFQLLRKPFTTSELVRRLEVRNAERVDDNKFAVRPAVSHLTMGSTAVPKNEIDRTGAKDPHPQK
jgi:two-component system, cell cycle sensor histidine kinase and response regulator CckA